MGSHLGIRDDNGRVEALVRASKSLADLLERDETALEIVVADGDLPDRAGYRQIVSHDAERGGIAGIRRVKHRLLAQIAARDLVGEIELGTVGRALADLADSCIEAGLLVLEAPPELAIIAMGKLGGRELNYSSDIDLVFVSEGDPGVCLPVAERLLAELGSFAPEGQAYRIDTNLRPEGRSGALVRSLDSCLEYYRRWAKTWEHQALLKARGAAGAGAGRELVEATRSIVFPDEVTSERVAAVRAMKERVEGHAARSSLRGRAREEDDVKLGPGGIRDIEFAVQLFQLVHGCTDPAVRSATTLEALSSLVDGGYVAEEDGAGLSVAYRWLRTVEHRLQLWQERQVHRLPASEEDRARLARVLGFRDGPDAGAGARFESAHRGVLSDVRSRFERLFYRPMIESLADPVGPRLSAEALRDRLRVLGFRDVERAARTLDGLVSGTSRRSKLFRVLTPALLRFLAGSPMPDEGLFSFLTLGEALEARLDVLGSLRDNPPGLALLAAVLGSGRVLGEVLAHVPEELAVISDPEGPGPPKDRSRLVREARSSLGWREPSRRLDGLRRFKRREMLHIGLSDLSTEDGASNTGVALADLADACLEAALDETEVQLAVIGMGKLGGRELNYSSDIDVMFVCGDDHRVAEEAAEELMRAIGDVTPEGQAFRIDAGLRPEGRNGPLVRTLDSYREYYERWSRPWEHLALIKARGSAGDPGLASGFLEIVGRTSYGDPPSAEALAEVRHLKARMERERIPRSIEPRRHLKLGPGGLSDIEFAVQLLQLTHGFEIEEMRVPPTLDALDAAVRTGLLDEPEAARLRQTYSFLMRLRNRLFFQFGRPVDTLPTKPEELEALGKAMGFADQPRQELEETYLRLTRRARGIAEPLIYG